jgi:cytoskeletal protein CcmA (bactofilin family)
MNKLIDDNQNVQAETIVGPSVKIQGDLNSEGNIRIEGQVNGKVKTSQGVYINQGAKIAADILAGTAIIGGEVQGNLKIAGHLILQSTAKVAGDIACNILRVEDGAQFTGKCAMNAVGNGGAISKKSTEKSEKFEKVEPEIEPEE